MGVALLETPNGVIRSYYFGKFNAPTSESTEVKGECWLFACEGCQSNFEKKNRTSNFQALSCVLIVSPRFCF